MNLTSKHSVDGYAATTGIGLRNLFREQLEWVWVVVWLDVDDWLII